MANELINQKITVTVNANGVADINGNVLQAPFSFCFYSCFCPYYSSVQLVRLRGGVFLNGVTDEAISLAILDASLWTDMEIQSPCVAGMKPENKTLLYGKISFVTNLTLINLFIAIIDKFGGGKSKRLADLSISFNGQSISDRLGELNDNNDFLRRFLLSCGGQGKGTSVKPKVAVKGGSRVDEPWIGRDWAGIGPLDQREVQLFIEVNGVISKNKPRRFNNSEPWN